MRRVPLLLCGLLLTGCGAAASRPAATAAAPVPGDATPTAATPTAAAPTAAPTCAPAAPTRFAWPAGVPADLPQPPSSRLLSTKRASDGVVVVRFQTPSSLRAGVLFTLDALPAAGFTLGRGDAEPAEADAPFTRGDLRGVMKMAATEPCRTDWLVAVVTAPRGTSPLLPTPAATPTASPTALPFG